MTNAPEVTHANKTDPKTALGKPWNVIVHDDPVTLMSYVVMVFRKTFGYPQMKAHTLMMEVHTKGRSIVWTGARERAEVYVHQLHAAQLLATLEHTDS